MAGGIPDPWSTAAQAPSSPLYGVTNAPTSAISFQDFLNQVKSRAKGPLKSLETNTQNLLQQASTPQARAGMRTAAGVGATALGVAPGAVQAFQQQGLFPGLASTAAGLGTAAIVAPVSNLLMRGNLPMKLAGGVLQALAPGLAQAGTAGLFGAAEEGKKGPGGVDVSIPGTPISPEVPVSEAARERLQRERDLEYERKRLETLGPAQIALDRQAMQDQMNAYVQLQKSLLPIQEQTMRQQLINQQALINTQSAAYQQLGRQAGAFSLAGRGMSEAGATLRTAISQNPYAGSTIQAPSISFG